MDARPAVTARVATTAAFAFHGLALAQWFVRIPDLKVQAGLDDGQLGFALLGSAVGSVSTMPIAGALVSRFGSRNVTRVFALLICTCFLLPSFATSQWTLFAGLVCFGMAVGGADVGFNSQASTVEKRYGQVLMSGFHGAWSVANLAGAVMATPLIAVGVAPMAHLVPTGVLAGLAIMVGTHWFLDDEPRTGEAPVRAVARLTPTLLALGTIAGLSLLVEGVVADWSGIYLRDVLGAPPTSAGIAFGAFSLAMAASRLTGDWILARFEPRAVLAMGSVLSASGLGAAVVSSDQIITIMGFAACGAGIGTTFPLALSVASRLPGQAPGAALSIVATMGYAGFLAGPPLIGTVTHLTSSLAIGVSVAIWASLFMVVLTMAVPVGKVTPDEKTPERMVGTAPAASGVG
jgi:MFS family permease